MVVLKYSFLKKIQYKSKKIIHGIIFIVILLLLMSPEFALIGLVDAALIDVIVVLIAVQFQIYSDFFWLKFNLFKSKIKKLVNRIKVL